MKESNLKNIKQKAVKIELDKERTLKFDLNAFAELEDIYGSFNDAIDALQSKNSVKALRALIYAGLKHEDKDLTLEKAGSLIDVRNLSEVSKLIQEAVSNDLPDKEDDSEEKNVKNPVE